MRYEYALLQRQARVVPTRSGSQEVWAWYIGKELATGLVADQSLQQAIAYAEAQGWQRVPNEIGADAALLRRRRQRMERIGR